MPKYISHCENETKQLAAKMAKEGKGHVFALTGELGAGKTVFVQGFAKGLEIKDKIISPTFVLIRQHQIPDTPKILYHIDLYRLENIIDIKQLGLKDLWSDPNNILLIEWAEKIKYLLPKDTSVISFEVMKDGTRRITKKNSALMI